MRVRCVTFNLKGLGDHWHESRFGLITRELRKSQPDVLCLQEAMIRHESPLYHQAREIGAALGLMYVVFSPYGNSTDILADRDQGGVAILSRWPIMEARGRRLPSGHQGGSDARVALFARVQTGDGPIGLLTTHLSWRAEESEIRLLQLGILLDELRRNPWGVGVHRFILAGDLNATPEEPCIRAALSELTDAYARAHPGELGYTWSSRNPLTESENLPDRRIDYVLCDPSAAVRRCEVTLDEPVSAGPPPGYASDHFGVLAELAWPSERA